MKLIAIMTLLITSAFAQATPVEMSVEFKPTQEKFNQIKKEVEEQIAKEKAERDSLVDEVIAHIKETGDYISYISVHTIGYSATRVAYKHEPCTMENLEDKITCEGHREYTINWLTRETYNSEKLQALEANIRTNLDPILSIDKLNKPNIPAFVCMTLFFLVFLFIFRKNLIADCILYKPNKLKEIIEGKDNDK